MVHLMLTHLEDSVATRRAYLPHSHSRIAIRKGTGVWRLQSRPKDMARLPTNSSGQTLVEFAFILPLVLLLMLGVVQVALIGGSALAVNQAAVACVRYAAVNAAITEKTKNTTRFLMISPCLC